MNMYYYYNHLTDEETGGQILRIKFSDKKQDYLLTKFIPTTLHKQKKIKTNKTVC